MLSAASALWNDHRAAQPGHQLDGDDGGHDQPRAEPGCGRQTVARQQVAEQAAERPLARISAVRSGGASRCAQVCTKKPSALAKTAVTASASQTLVPRGASRPLVAAPAIRQLRPHTLSCTASSAPVWWSRAYLDVTR